MLETNDFLKAGYIANEITEGFWLLKKTLKDKYVIKVLADSDGFEPEVEFNTSPISRVTLQVDNRTSIQDIEEFFELMHKSLCKSLKIVEEK